MNALQLPPVDSARNAIWRQECHLARLAWNASTLQALSVRLFALAWYSVSLNYLPPFSSASQTAFPSPLTPGLTKVCFLL